MLLCMSMYCAQGYVPALSSMEVICRLVIAFDRVGTVLYFTEYTVLKSKH
jgi:hypothetical protein